MRANRRMLLLFLLVLALGQLQCIPALWIVPRPPVSSLASRVWNEVNVARTDPEVYAEYLESWLPRFQGDRLVRTGTQLLQMDEGRPAVEEAIRFLRETRPRPTLSLSDGMSRGAFDLVRDHGPVGGMGHEGRDGSTVAERIRRYGVWNRKAGEVIAYGATDPREIVALFIVNDGNRGRTHRRVMFDPDYHVMGAALGPHAQYGEMCVITLAANYRETHPGVRQGEQGE